MHRVLLIDDDERLGEMLCSYLASRGFEVERRLTGLSGLSAAARADVDAVMLDVMLPDLDGFEVLRRLRASTAVPVLMLTARGEDTDRIVGLELGADDYLPKPFNPRELVARLQAILRRRDRASPRSVLRFGELEIDRDAREVRLAGRPRALTSRQFDILCVLAENSGRVLSRAQLFERVSGEEIEAFDRSIDVHISRIRALIEPDPKEPHRLLTVRGAGYVFTREGT